MRIHFVVGALLIAAAYACGSSEDSSIIGPGEAADGGNGGNGGDSSTGTNPNPGTDAGKQSATDAGPAADGSTPTDSGTNAPDGSTTVDAGTDAGVCIKGTTAPGNGHHNPGQDCLTCHDGSGGAPKWTVAGTLYDKATAGAAVSGATIEVIDANNQKLDLVSNSNGNFYTGTTVKFPLTVRASDCPTNNVMTATVANGSCNTAGCHDSAMRIHVP